MRSTASALSLSESVLTNAELATISASTMFIWGTDDPYLSPDCAQPAIRRMPAATLHELPAGHGPWLVQPRRTAELIRAHLGHAVPVESPCGAARHQA